MRIDSDLLPPPDSFTQFVDAHGIVFDRDDITSLAQFLTLLREANKIVNLTRIVEANDMWIKHVYDSLTLLPIIASCDAHSVCDIGSGGGVPGIPLATTLPQVQFTLVEATGKKARFLESVAETMTLSNVRVVSERAETIGQDHQRFRDRFDLVTARAVGALPVSLELAIPIAKVGGLVALIRGQQAAEEVAAAKQAMHLLHCAVVDLIPTETGVIVVTEKLRSTPRLYPRRPGEPKRVPLGTTAAQP